jgi:hypothetical protein
MQRPIPIIAAQSTRSDPAASTRWLPPILLSLGFLAQALLWLNPGYFSHDELQWGFHADVARLSDLPWVSWTDIQTFQFRPLTFNTWLLLSHQLFDTPRLFHAVFVALGTLNALLLFLLVRRELGSRAGMIAFGLFLFSPYVALVHGWVATLADLLWLAAALLAVMLTRWGEATVRGSLLAAACFGLTAVGLLAKEAALAIPALLGLGWLLHHFRRAWGWAFAGAMLAAVVYLLLRLGPLAEGSSGGSYGWALGAVPLRWGEYLLFPWVIGRLEPVFLLQPPLSRRLLLAVLLLLCTAVAVYRASPRLLLAWLAGGLCALGPTLVLAASSSQYAYGFAAVSAACLAAAWHRGDRIGRVLLLVPLLVMVGNGVHAQYRMLSIGEVQQRFFADLIHELAIHESVSAVVAEPSGEWQFRRFTHDISGYRGTPIGDRIRLVQPTEPASHEIESSGALRPIAD